VSRALIVLWGSQDREQAAEWIAKAPAGTRVEFKANKRTLPQNDKLWACLSDVARQVKWHGQKLSTNDWKAIFIAALRKELRVVPNLDNTGFVSLGHSSSDLSKEEMSDLISLIEAWGTEHGVVFHDAHSEAA
jgi:hypothetical protein